MIYPEYFPEERAQEHAERKVFDRLKELSDRYDIFYSKRFVTDGLGKKAEFEVDFIVAIPEKALVCIEVKGGKIHYDGARDVWSQNGSRMSKRPDGQATAASHALAKALKQSLGQMALGWALCFPDCQVQHGSQFPSSVASAQVIDEQSLLYVDQALADLFAFTQKQQSHRQGARRWEYDRFKKSLLRDLGFVSLVGTRIKRAQQQFVMLEASQIELFESVASNRHILVSGPAGSGKTMLAKTAAQDLVNDGKRVLLMCFNRTLANKLRYEFERNEELIEVTTFHSLARTVISAFDPDWWKVHGKTSGDDFWELDVPAKLEECLPYYQERYDALIVDEGQDFKEFWYELIFKLIPRNGRRLIFLDEMQNIFGHYTGMPDVEAFSRFSLRKNCRNSKSIVRYLSELVGQEIPAFDNSPEGAEVIEMSFPSQSGQFTFLDREIKELTKHQGIDPTQVLILLNSTKADSCLAGKSKIGGQTLESLDNKGRLNRGTVHYTSIKTFKGLESDVIFVLDANRIDEALRLKSIYTQVSRARHKLYLLGV